MPPKAADGVIRSAQRFYRTDHPGASRHPSFSSFKEGKKPVTYSLMRSP